MSSRTQPVKILIPDAHDPLMWGVLSCFSDISNIKLYVMSELEYIPIRYSRYINKFYYSPPFDETLDWINRINDLVLKHQIDVVFPLFVTAIRNLIKFKNHLIKPEAFLIPDSLEHYDIANNKGLLADCIKELDLPRPKHWHIDKSEPLKNLDDINVFPILLKPTLDSGAGRGIVKFNDKNALVSYLEETELNTPHFLQESIDGYDMGCHLLCKEGEILAVAMQEGFLFSKKPFTPQAGMNMIFEDAVFEQAKKLMKALNWSGLADLDLRYDNKSGTFMIIEINPRAWITILGPNTAGVNFPWLYCKAVIGEKFDIPEFSRSPYYNRLGLRLALAKNPLMLFRLNILWRYTPIKYQLKDPILSVLEFFWILKKIMTEKFGRPKTYANKSVSTGVTPLS
jgi:predicted ATP-grasp superfamily ATP-dependent carboligase